MSLWWIVFLVAAAAGAYFGVRRVVVFEYERGLRYLDGRFVDLAPPGGYWLFPLRTVIRKIDLRPTVVSVPGQEVLSADGVTVKVSLAATYQVVDPVAAVHGIADFQAALYVQLQMALRELVGNAAADDLLASRPEFGRRLREATGESAAKLGVEVKAVDVKDIMFPGELKKIFAEVVRARKEGQAALERARAETATLRHLANATKAVERNPTLMQLRLLQAIENSSGNKIVMNVPAADVPVGGTPDGGAETSRGSA